MDEKNENVESSSDDYRIGTRTDIGLKRQANEDFLTVHHTRHGLLLVVCDGMGGHVGGARASSLAAETFVRSVETSDGDAATLLSMAVAAADEAVTDESTREPSLAGMGTTLVAALLNGPRAVVVNVGDSRACHFHAGRLLRITDDHSMVGEMVRRGEITEEEAAVHPRRNVITKALGGFGGVSQGDIFTIELAPGDILLLSTDGLHGLIPDPAISTRLASGRRVEQIADDLVNDALAAGGNDNITVIVAALARPGEQIIDPDTDSRSGSAPSADTEHTGSGAKKLTIFLLFGIPLAAMIFFLWLFPLFSPTRPTNGTPIGIADSLSSLDSTIPGDTGSTADSTAPWDRIDDSVRVGDTIDIL